MCVLVDCFEVGYLFAVFVEPRGLEALLYLKRVVDLC